MDEINYDLNNDHGQKKNVRIMMTFMMSWKPDGLSVGGPMPASLGVT